MYLASKYIIQEDNMNKKFFLILPCILVLGLIIIIIYGLKEQQDISVQENTSIINTEKEIVMTKPSIIEENMNTFIEKLNVKENPARGAAERLNEAGCGKIINITDLDKSEGAYSMRITDDKNDVYDITMSYEGYLGTVKDKEGNYLIMPID